MTKLGFESLELRRLLTTITVNSALDGAVDLSDDVVTLRDALEAANSDVAVSPGGPVGSGVDTVAFDVSLAGGVIRLAEGQLEITDQVVIDGTSLGITVTGDAGGNDVLVAGTNITDVAATIALDPTRLDDNSRVIRIVGIGSTTTIHGLTITGGRTGGNNGGGGGIRSAASLTMNTSTVSGNSTTGNNALGGGLYVANATSSPAALTLTNSTVSGNTTSGDIARGGGIYTDGGADLTNSTVARNSTVGLQGTGGAIHSTRHVSLINSTVAGNSTTGGQAAGGAISAFDDVTLTNSIVTGNVAVNAGNDDIRIISGSVVLEGGTFVGDTLSVGSAAVQSGLTAADVFESTIEVVDGIGAGTGVFSGVLADNGGLTQTMALLVGGVAANAGDSTAGTLPAFDQRGTPFIRQAGSNVDIGAFEVLELIVDSRLDESDGDFSGGDFSLREALEVANSLPGAHTITFDDTLAGRVIRLTEGQLEITEEVTIDGGSLGITISGDANDNDLKVDGTGITDVAATIMSDPTRLDDNTRVLEIFGIFSDTTIVGLTITGGRTTDFGADGGGIRSRAALTFVNSTISGNSTSSTSAEGGGISSAGPVSLTSSTVSGNSTAGGSAHGGGIFAISAVSLTSSSVSGNSTAGGSAIGGGINTSGEVTLTNSMVTGNVAVNAGSNQIQGSVNRLGGTIQGGTLRHGSSTIATGLAASDIFADTTLLVDGQGNTTSMLTGVLADNGGGTATLALLADGAAVDSGDSSLATDIAFDQRSAPFVRVVGSSVDIGAYEALPLIVDTQTDESDGDFSSGDFSLREALQLANLGSNSDTVTFDASLAGGLIRLTEGQLGISEAVILDGAGLGITITGDANGDDVLVAGTSVTDVGRTINSSAAETDGIDNDDDGLIDAADTDGENLLDDNGRVLNISGDGSDTTLIGLTITGGRTTERYHSGGGVSSAADLTILNSNVSGNSTTGGNARGGGIAAEQDLTLANSTVSGNSTRGRNAGGGGIAAGSFQPNSFDTLRLINSTVVGNSTSGSNFADGGGILATGVVFTNSLVTGNVSVNREGSDQLFRNGNNLTRLGGTIIGNTLRDGNSTIASDLSADEIFATTTEVLDADGTPTGVFTGVLADNGGTTTTVAIQFSGPAFDTGSSRLAAGIEFDQRGEPFVRVAGTNVDIGAFELQAPASLVVDTLNDEFDSDFGPGNLSLREAISWANVTAGADTITFDASLGGGVIRLTEGQLEITEEVTVDGGGLGITITGDAGGNDVLLAGTQITDVGNTLTSDPTLLDDNARVFDIVGGDSATTFIGLTITGGRTTLDAEGGGGVRSTADLTIVGGTISGNSTAGATARGGGIVAGALALINVTVAGNSTSGTNATGGAIWSGTFNIASSTITANSTTGGNASGGAIFAVASSTLNNSIVTGNVALNAGNDQIHLFIGPLTRRGGTIVGGTLRDGNSVITTGLTAADIFAETTEVIDGQGNPTGVPAGILTDNGGLVPTIAILGDGAADGNGDPSFLRDDDFDLDGDGDTTEALPIDANGNGRVGVLLDIGAVEALEPESLFVTTLDDVVDGADFSTSLREAINFANAQNGADTITFDASLGGGVIRLTEGQLEIQDEVTIDGADLGITITGDAAADDVLVPGTHITNVAASVGVLNDNSRVVNISGSNSTTELIGLTISGGRTTANFSAGGGIRSEALLLITDSTVAGNSTTGRRSSGGGIFSSTATLQNSSVSGNRTTGESAEGGGINSFNQLTFINSTVSGNSTAGKWAFGGGIHVSNDIVLMINSTVSGNATSGEQAFGGGIMGQENVSLTNSTVSGNSTSGSSADGGGLWSIGDVTLTNSIVTGNVAVNGHADEISTFAATIRQGGTIIGDTLRDGGKIVDSGLTVGDIFASTARVIDGEGNRTVVFAGVLADNDGLVPTIALRGKGAADGKGDPSFLPDDDFDLDGDGDMTEALPIDANGNERINGSLDIGAVEAFESGSLVVTTPQDVVDIFDFETSLREALNFANAQAGADTVVFDAGLVGGVIRLTSGDLVIEDEVTIDGAGLGITITGDAAADDVLVPGTNITNVADSAGLLGDNSRVININGTGSTTTLVGLSITGGRTAEIHSKGGGIRSAADLIIVNSIVSGNSTNGRFAPGGGIAASSVTLANSTVSRNHTTGRASEGAGIHATGDVELFNSSVSRNSTTGPGAGGGGISGNNVTLTSSTVSGNSTTTEFGYGGGIYALERVRLTNSIVTGNVAVNHSSDEIHHFLGLTRQGGTIVGNTLQDGGTIVRSNLNAGDIFASTTEVIDGEGNPTGVFAGVLADNGGLVPTIALRGKGAADGKGDPSFLPDDGFDLDGDGDSTETLPIDANGNGRVGGLLDIGAVEAFENGSLVVTTLDDISDPADTETSLREAIYFANSRPRPDTVTFDTSLASGVIRLTEGQLRATQSITIDGLGLGITITGDANGDDILLAGTNITDVPATNAAGGLEDNTRVLSVGHSGATLNGLTITGGRVTGSLVKGGGINSSGPLSITNSTVSGNSTSGWSAKGGGVHGGRMITLTNSTVSMNATSGDIAGGGGISGPGGVKLYSSTVSGNSADGQSAKGGGIEGAGRFTLVNSIVSGNWAESLFNDMRSINHAYTYEGGTIAGRKLRQGKTTIQTGLTAADIFAQTAKVLDSEGNPTNVSSGVLANNGGPTPTLALLPGGAANNTGDWSYLPLDVDDLDGDGDTTEVIPLDQRGLGFDRFRGGAPDIGAFEVQRAPQVESVSIDNDADIGCTEYCQRSMVRKLTVTFDAEVSIDPGAFSLTHALGDNSSSFTIADADVTTSVVDGKTVVLLTFENSTTGIVGGSLVDGNYRLTIDATRIRSAVGSDAMAADHTDDFFRFFGDVDGDSDVDTRDFLQFRGTYRKTDADAAFNELFDFDGDGDVDTRDFLQFRTRYRTTLPA